MSGSLPFAVCASYVARPGGGGTGKTMVHTATCPVVLAAFERAGPPHWPGEPDYQPPVLLTAAAAADMVDVRCSLCAPDLQPRPRPVKRSTSGLGWPTGDGGCARNPLRRDELYVRPVTRDVTGDTP